MTHRLRGFAEALYLKRHFEGVPPAKTVLSSVQRPLKTGVSLNPLQTLKRVSGRLTRLLHGREKPKTNLRRLLIVDDEQSICFSMREYFTHHGFMVDTASEAEQAERLIDGTNYQVIIQDLRLGTTTNSAGLEIVRHAHQRSPETRIIVLTAYGSNEAEIDAKASGADAFLRKPLPLSQVAQVVRGLIESPRSRMTPNA